MTTQNRSGFGPGFARDIEALMSILVFGAQTGVVYMHIHEVRENLRIAGCRLDQNLPDVGPMEFDFDENYEPDFGPEDEIPAVEEIEEEAAA